MAIICYSGGVSCQSGWQVKVYDRTRLAGNVDGRSFVNTFFLCANPLPHVNQELNSYGITMCK